MQQTYAYLLTYLPTMHMFTQAAFIRPNICIVNIDFELSSDLKSVDLCSYLDSNLDFITSHWRLDITFNCEC